MVTLFSLQSREYSSFPIPIRIRLHSDGLSGKEQVEMELLGAFQELGLGVCPAVGHPSAEFLQKKGKELWPQ